MSFSLSITMTVENYPGSYDIKITVTPPGTVSNSSYSGNISPVVATTDLVVGQDTPTYEAIVESGGILPVNNYTRETSRDYGISFVAYDGTSVTLSGGTTTTRYCKCRRNLNWRLSLADFKTIYAKEIQHEKNIVRARIAKKIRDTRVQSAVELKEFKDTRRMIADAARKVLQYQKLFSVKNAVKLTRNRRDILKYLGPSAAKRMDLASPMRDKSRIRKAAEAVNDSYLEFTYGWNPLVGTLEEACKLAYDQITSSCAKPEYIRASHGIRLINDIVGKDSDTGGPYSTPPLSYKKHLTAEIIVRMGGRLSSSAPSSLEPWGISASEIVPSLWEATTFSFVADYFTNMGDWVSNLSLDFMKLDQSTCWQSVRYKGLGRFTHIAFSPTATSNWQPGSIASRTLECVEFNRYERSKATYDDFRVRFEFVDPSTKQLLNTASLVFSFIL